MSTALSFLASVSEREQNKDLFGNPDTMQSICDLVRLDVTLLPILTPFSSLLPLCADASP